MQIIVKGPRILIKPKKIESTTKSGLVIADSTKKKEQHGQAVGEVLQIGEECWKDVVDEVEYFRNQNGNLMGKQDVFRDPWCKVGDTIVYRRYAGMKIPDETTKDGFVKDVLIVNDKDILAVIGE